MTVRIAAIDFGTNTARLLIASMDESGCFEHLHVERQIVRLGGGFCRERGLSSEALKRATDCLARFAEIISVYGVTSVRAVATSAVRDAVNGQAFVDAVLSRFGILLNVIDGDTEARLALAGVAAGLDHPCPDMLLFDIGGGSTEYTLVQNNRTEFTSSLPLGVVRLTEGKVTVESIQDKIRRELEGLVTLMASGGHAVKPASVLIGTAGTATTLAAISMQMQDYDYRRINNSVVTRKQVQTIFDRLLPFSPEERLKVPGLEKGREDLIIAGTLITIQTMDLFGMERMQVSDYGLLEGLVVAGGFLDD